MFILVAFSCATEDAVVYDTVTSPAPSARIINADEIRAIPGVAQKLDQLKKAKTDLAGKPVQSVKYNFEIDTEQALLIEKDGYHSLTFPIKYDDTKEELTNLFLHPYGDGYLSYLLTYKMDHDDFIKLNDGTPIEKLSENLKIEYLQDLDMNLSIASGFTNEDIWSKPGEPFWHNGVCSKFDQTIYNPDGTATGEMTIVPCPKCECPEVSSGGSGGAGGGGGFWWVMSPVYFAVIDIQPRGGGGGGSPSGPVYSPFNPQPMSPTPIAGYPLPILGAVSPELPKGGDKNCEELKKISQQIAVSNALKDLKNRIGLSQEVGYSFHSQGLSTTTQIHYGDMNGSSVNIPDGGDIYGGGHVHYNDGTPIIGASVPMFSPEDIIKLFRFIYKYNYNGANQNDLINKFVFMVTTNQGTYAIKANSMLFRTKLFAIYHDKEKKEKFIMKLRNAQSSKKTSDSPESFQKQFLDFAAAENLELLLYKANSEFTQWAKLSIDSDSNTGIKEENCN